MHDPDTQERLFYVAARGHHADVGGIAPGSMPPFSRTIDEEGVQFRNVRVMDKGHFLEKDVRDVLASGSHPARRPDNHLGFTLQTS